MPKKHTNAFIQMRVGKIQLHQLKERTEGKTLAITLAQGTKQQTTSQGKHHKESCRKLAENSNLNIN